MGFFNSHIHDMNDLINKDVISFILTWLIIFIFLLSFHQLYKEYNKWYLLHFKEKEKEKENIEKDDDPFILCFRKTRLETILMSRVEDISKSRDIQFAISCFYYNNDSSIKGSIYIVTSKVLYKLFFIKNTLICHNQHEFNTFISQSNNTSYTKIKNYLDNNCEKKAHHTEFYTWPYYYFTKNYNKEYKNLEYFLSSF